jgi:hypothetical protein
VRGWIFGGIALATAATFWACSLHDTSYLDRGDNGEPDVVQRDAFTPDAGPDEAGDNPTRTATVFVPNQNGPRLLVQDDASLYWVNNDGNLLAFKKDGSDATPRLVAQIGPGVTFVVAEEGSAPDLFYTSEDKVFSVPKSGGAPAAIGTTLPPPVALGIDPSYVFAMADDGDNGTSGQSAGLYRFQHDGGATVVLHRATDTGGRMYGMALQGTDVFWDEGAGAFYSLVKNAPADAGPQVYAATQGTSETATGPLAFSLDDKAFYYSDGTLVRSHPRVVSSAAKTLIGFPDSTISVRAIAIDDRSVYAVDDEVGGSLRRNDKSGTTAPETMLSDLATPNSLVVDGNSVYIAVEGPPGQIVKCAK